VKRNSYTDNEKPGIRSVAGARDPLSNFFLCRFIFRMRNFRSLEHAYQWEKALFFGYEGVARRIDACGTAAQAKQLAKEIPHSENWDRVRISFMRELLRLKWEQVPIFRSELLASSGKSLEHSVPDTFWGTGSARRQGKNIFGWLLNSLPDLKTGNVFSVKQEKEKPAEEETLKKQRRRL
jgi:ribA/ribD-fused uncharacterized protein